MKVLMVGGGGREHALAWKLRRDDPSAEIISAPGNPGLAELGRCVAVGASDIAALTELARSERPDLTIVGPEAPLAAGIVDAFRAERLSIFGPTAAAARIESSKSFAKELMLHAGVPTARAERHTNAETAKRAVRELGATVVIKASGLAAGKGVIVCESIADADAAIDSMLEAHTFGGAGDEILVEEFMEGEELSIFAITDGTELLTMLPARDHKRLLEGDRGPNTGGMGAYAPVADATPDLVDDVVERIFRPTLRALRERDAEFTGLLYAGLMLTDEGPRVVEFNCRFGDPETEALMPLLESSLLEPCLAVARGDGLRGGALRWSSDFAVTTVLAAEGYPESPRKGAPITLPPPANGVHIFHAGTARDADGRLVTSGGRVLAVTAVAPTMDEARAASVSAAAQIEFEGKHFRSDIGRGQVFNFEQAQPRLSRG
ncbi:MAG TPA: phosphoribosylamine--glycine ligase [Gemmatimonadaceae bacterium]|nr:phosphoribosylamine--glycine ligase [Gemmatimonadaceae bacterium]